MTSSSFLVRPGRSIRLSRLSTDRTQGVSGKDDAVRQLEASVRALSEEQERLYAQDQWALLVIFQAMDGAGKDSTIKHVMSGVNPQGVHVTSFKAPSATELDHDYLWRSAVALPTRGMIGIHNRSHYEEVIVTRVHPDLLTRQRLPNPPGGRDFWKRRFRQINAFEQHLVENGTAVVKFFLNVSKEEQRRRFEERLDKPEKHWKFALQDVRERAHWDDYMRAYEDVLAHTSTKHAPWFVIPADRKWFMHLAVGRVIVDVVKKLDLRMAKPSQERLRELSEGRRLLMEEGRRAPRSGGRS